MPPRYVYWTILIDGKATAFRARERDELLPTFNQLARKNRDIAMRYFARGKLWDTPEQAEWAVKSLAAPRETRSRDWRPGGTHQDPRARFKRSKSASGATDRGAHKNANRDARGSRGKVEDNRPAGSRPSSDRPAGNSKRPGDQAGGGTSGPTAGPARKSWSGGRPRKPR